MEKKYPFKFLDSYNQNDTDMFFGRDEEIAALYEMVFQNSMLLVYGASGTGKTSLIQCGLAGRFKSYDWLALTIRRGTNINAALEKALIAAGGNEIDDEEAMTNNSAQKLTGLLRLIKGVYLNSFKPVYLIFDQFEELYILGTKDEQEKFIEAVKELLKAEQPVKMIFSIREEYLGHLFEFEKEVPQLLRKKLRVEPMTLNKVTDVIKGINSFALSNVRIKADEVDAITQGIFERLRGKKKTLTIQLPYLQVFLDKLYLETTKDETRKADALIELSVLNRIGDIGDVLRNFLEEQVTGISKKLSRENRNVNPETIWKILSPFSTLEGTKEPISKKELGERLKDIDNKLIDEAVESFVNSRILNFSESTNLYELAHDSLALRIAEKRSDEEISLLEVRRLIKSQVSLKQDAKELFSKKQLNFIEPHLNKLNLNDQENQLITQSKEAIHRAEAKIKTRRRRILITIAAITILVIGSLAYLLVQASVAKNKNKLLLANNYWNNTKSEKAENDYGYALANAAQAIELSNDTALARKILIDIDHQWPLVTVENIIVDQSEVSIAVYSAEDSNIIVTIGKDFILKRWDATSGKMIRSDTLEIKDKEYSGKKVNQEEIVGFTADAKKIISVDQDGLLHLSLVKDGKKDPAFSTFNQSKEFNKEAAFSFNGDGTKLIMFDVTGQFLWFIDLTTSSNTREIELPLVAERRTGNYDQSPRISSLVLNADGTKFLYLLNGTKIFMGDTKTGKTKELQLELPEPEFNPNELLTSVDPKLQNTIDKKYYTADLTRVSFSSDEKIIITAAEDGSVRLWNIENKKQDGPELTHRSSVLLAFIIPNTGKIFTKDEDGSTYIWDRKTGEHLGHGVKRGTSSHRVTFRSDGKQLLAVEHNTVFVLKLLQNDFTQNYFITNEDLSNPGYSPDVKKIAIADTINNGLVFQLLDSKTLSQIGLNMAVGKKLTRYDLNNIKIFSPDSKKLLTAIDNTTMLLWDVEKQKQIGNNEISWKNTRVDEEEANLSEPVFSPDSKKIAVIIDSAIQVINAETGKPMGKKIPFTHSSEKLMDWHIVFNADSTRILTHKYYFNFEGTAGDVTGATTDIRLWNIQTGKQIGKEIIYYKNYDEGFLSDYNEESRARLLGMNYTPASSPPVFSSDGKRFLTNSKYNSTCQIWDAETGKQIGNNIVFKSQWAPFFRHDGRSIAVAVNDSVTRYFDSGSGKPAKDSIKHWSAQISPIISPDGKWILTFQKNGTLKLLNAASGKEVKENADFKHQLASALPGFSPNGKLFITTDQSGFIRLWESSTGKQKGPAMRHKTSRVMTMTFSPDGQKILTRIVSDKSELGSEECAAVIWDAETGKQIKEAIEINCYDIIKSSSDGELIAISELNPRNFREHLITELENIETGDLDIPTDLLKLQVYMVTGYKFDFETNEKIPLTPQEFRDIKTRYDSLARKHFRNCRYYNFNFWKIHNEEEAKKIRLEPAWGKKTITIDQFTILPKFQPGDSTIKQNNGSFLAPNQAIVSENRQYMLAYHRDGDLVIYRIAGMEVMWSSGTFGMPAYRTVMQYDGNLVIYYADPGTRRGSNVAWSSDTWENNAGARLVLEDDGLLVIYNTKNEIVWQNNLGKVKRGISK